MDKKNIKSAIILLVIFILIIILVIKGAKFLNSGGFQRDDDYVDDAYDDYDAPFIDEKSLTVINFEDDKLKEAVLKELGSYYDDVTVSDIESLTELTI